MNTVTAKARVKVGDHQRDLVYRIGTSDLAVIRQTFQDREVDLGDLARWPEIEAWFAGLDKPPLIVDCGAYIGTTAVYFAMRFPSAKVMAFEPNPDSYALLMDNTKGINVQPLWMGVGSDPSTAAVVDDPGGHSSRCRLERGNDVAVTTVGAAVKSNPDHTPFLIKIDIEGGEDLLFMSNIGWVDRFPIIIVELHDWLYPKQGLSQSFLAAMAGRPRDLIIKGEYLVSIAHDLNAGLANAG